MVLMRTGGPVMRGRPSYGLIGALMGLGAVVGLWRLSVQAGTPCQRLMPAPDAITAIHRCYPSALAHGVCMGDGLRQGEGKCGFAFGVQWPRPSGGYVVGRWGVDGFGLH